MEKWEIGTLLRYEYCRGSWEEEAARNINSVFGSCVITPQKVSEYFGKFFLGEFEVENDPSRSPKSVKDSKRSRLDNVKWDKEQEEKAKKVVEANSDVKYDKSEGERFEHEAQELWDKFYSQHKNKFFKDRHWLFMEFPELNVPDRNPDNKVNVLEIGCGVGNTVIPLLQSDSGKSLFIYACDFSPNAVKMLQEHSLYNESLCKAFVLDVTSDKWNVPFPKNSLDVVTVIFVLSAINPEKHGHVVRTLKEYLKPGGLVLFRDYARYDMTQLRFKKGQCISDNFYARGDGTRVYFTTPDEVRALFVNEGFKEEQILLDRQLQVNRGKMLKMYRAWIVAKFRKSS